jgi:hypothetical protein
MREKASKVLFSLWRAAELGCLSVLIWVNTGTQLFASLQNQSMTLKAQAKPKKKIEN